jgi:hypothetical protein
MVWILADSALPPELTSSAMAMPGRDERKFDPGLCPWFWLILQIIGRQLTRA